MDELLQILADWNRWWETGEVLPELIGKGQQYTVEFADLVTLVTYQQSTAGEGRQHRRSRQGDLGLLERKRIEARDRMQVLPLSL